MNGGVMVANELTNAHVAFLPLPHVYNLFLPT